MTESALATIGAVLFKSALALDSEQIGQGQSPQSDRPDRQEAAAADRFLEASRHLEVSLFCGIDSS